MTSPVTVSQSGLVRVTVSSGTRRVDLVLPGAVPVAELVPELARSVGLLDAATVYGGYRLVTSDGRPLAHDSGLTLQGVDDGAVITVTAGVDEPAPMIYDDVVEAMTDVVEHDLKPWEASSGRTTALGAAVLLLALGAAALLVQGSSQVAASAAAMVAVALV
ncbi:MAG: EsaB/YukD family protein, partial [Nocardioides sp.]